MFFSKKYKILFIASPKTGSISMQEAFKKLDPKGVGNIIEFDNKKVTQYDVDQGIMGHAKAREFKKALGANTYNKLNTIAVVRHPYSKLVSSYFFMKKTKLNQAFFIKGKKNKLKRSIRYFLSSLMPKLMPFQIWALFFPFRSNLSYVTDYNGSLIVKYLMRTEHLNDDFQSLMQKLDINSEGIQVGQKNTSDHKTYEHYFKTKWFRNKMYKKLKADIDFYDKITKQLES